MPTNSKKKEAYLKERESGFNLRFTSSSRRQLPEYNALRDINMQNYFESESVQKHLLETGQVDQFGRIISQEDNRSRLRIVENEIGRAEKLQKVLEKDEDDVRYLIRKERFRDIDKNRRLENVDRRKIDTKKQMELTRIEREVLGHSHLYTNNRETNDGSFRVKRKSSQELVSAGSTFDCW